MVIRLAAALLILLCAAPLAAQSCPGDCNGDAAVAVNELTLAVNIALERRSVADCFAADRNFDGRVVVSELISAVRVALDGCPSVAARAAFEAARQRFAALGAHSYDYNYQRFCFCFDPPDVDIQVRADTIVSIRDAQSGLEVAPQDPNAYLTIPQLFDYIDSALRTADVINVTYDEQTGVPRSLSIDFQEEAVDDEISISVPDFQIVEDTSCRGDTDCAEPASQCVEPGGFIGCGVCQNLEGECTVDTDCSGDLVCALSSPSACSCQGPVLVCQEGCGGDGDCVEGQICDAERHCRARPCNTANDCPTQFVCVEDGGVCARRACADDVDCAAPGRCVNTLCYGDFGTCEAIPP